jgi:predicted secreted protein
MLIVIDSGFQQAPAKSRPSSPGAPAADGAPETGHAWWRLRATGAGTTSFGLRYFRPWEPDADPNPKEFTITVNVKPRG